MSLSLYSFLAFSGLVSTLVTIITSAPFIGWCKRYFQAQRRENGPAHHEKKNNTPVMGGLLIIGSALVGIAGGLWNTGISWDITATLALVTCICFGIIGFIDDWAKVFSRRGITAKQKFVAQWGIAFTIAALWYVTSSPAPLILLPLGYTLSLPALLGTRISTSLIFIPWAAFIIVATSNAVNLTDGLDGLASSTLCIVFACFGGIALLTGQLILACIAFAFSGATLGFLWCNAYPALIFMGDVGSLALGATLGYLAIATRYEYLLPIAGIIFVSETVSVILQVGSYKLRGKRIFRMAPLHHHFELSGWPETRVVTRAFIVTVLATLIALTMV